MEESTIPLASVGGELDHGLGDVKRKREGEEGKGKEE